MRHPARYANAAKKATNVSLAEPLLAEAKELRINVPTVPKNKGSSDNAVGNRLSDFFAVTPVRVECLGF